MGAVNVALRSGWPESDNSAPIFETRDPVGRVESSAFAIVSWGRVCFPEVGLPRRHLSEGFLPVNNSLNLASKPFNNRIVPWVLTATILFVSLIGLVLVVRLTTAARAEALTAEAEINMLRQKEKALLEAAKTVENAFTPNQRQALPAAHELVDRKGFSWSRLLADLESSLPNNIRVSRIAVREVSRRGNQTEAQLELAVFAQNASTISDWISALHTENVFNVELRNQNLQKGRGESGTEYELSVIYRPRASYAVDSVAEVGNSKLASEVNR